MRLGFTWDAGSCVKVVCHSELMHFTRPGNAGHFQSRRKVKYHSRDLEFQILRCPRSFATLRCSDLSHDVISQSKLASKALTCSLQCGNQWIEDTWEYTFPAEGLTKL